LGGGVGESASGCVQCLSYIIRLFKGLFFFLYLNVEFLSLTLLLPQVDGWMSDHYSEILSEYPFSYLLFAIGQATMLKREGFTIGCTHVNND